jgi:hypothetical protein
MKTSKQEQFNKGIERLKNTHLSLDAKNSIKERLSIHTKTYIPKIKFMPEWGYGLWHAPACSCISSILSTTRISY